MSSATQQAPTSFVSPDSPPSNRWASVKGRLSYTQERAMTVVLIILIVVFSFTAPAFLTASNFQAVGSATSFYAIVAVGMTVLFIVGEFDLSLGAVYGIIGTVIAYANSNGSDPWISLIIGFIVAAAIGFLNGYFTSFGKVPSFIITIGMLSVLQGLSQYISGGQPMQLEPNGLASSLATFAAAEPLGISMSIWVALVVFVGAAFLLRRTRLGAHIYLTGGNVKAARQVGINVNRVKIICFVFAALLAGLVGALQVFGLGTAQPGTGSGDFLFQAVGAAIIGGVALNGGDGSIYGTFIGAAILGVLTNGLVLSGIDPGLGTTVTGALIIVAGLLQSGIRQFLASLFRRGRARQARSQLKA